MEGLTEWIYPERKKREPLKEKEKKTQKTEDKNKKGLISSVFRGAGNQHQH